MPLMELCLVAHIIYRHVAVRVGREVGQRKHHVGHLASCGVAAPVARSTAGLRREDVLEMYGKAVQRGVEIKLPLDDEERQAVEQTRNALMSSD